MVKPRPAVLVTGAPRSGTTWTGRILSEADGVAALHEPLNPTMTSTWPRVPRFFLHIGAHNADVWEPAVRRALELRYPLGRNVLVDRSLAAASHHFGRWWRWRRMAAAAHTLVVKDPIAIFSSEWLVARFDLHPLFLVRHPAGVVSSLVRLGWRARFEQWTGDERLMDGLLRPVAEEVERAAARPPDLLGAAALLWSATAVAITALTERHTNWLVVRYEDLARDPVGRATEVFDRLGLTMGPAVAARIRATTEGPSEVDPALATRPVNRDSRAAAMTWARRLEPDEQHRVRRLTEPWSGRWFGDRDWDETAT